MLGITPLYLRDKGFPSLLVLISFPKAWGLAKWSWGGNTLFQTLGLDALGF